MLRLGALLLPVLLPSWRFFQTIEASPRIEWCDAAGQWREYRPRPPHVGLLQMLGRLFWNRERNEALFLVSLSERVAEGEVDFPLREIEARLRSDLAPVAPQAFRLVFVRLHAGRWEREVVHLSRLAP